MQAAIVINTIKNILKLLSGVLDIIKKFKDEWETIIAIDTKIRQSPTRFERAVIMAALKDFLELKYATSKKDVTPKPSHPKITDTIFGE